APKLPNPPSATPALDIATTLIKLGLEPIVLSSYPQMNAIQRMNAINWLSCQARRPTHLQTLPSSGNSSTSSSNLSANTVSHPPHTTLISSVPSSTVPSRVGKPSYMAQTPPPKKEVE
ncbi:hypothetical protein FRC17_008037, partial [Serendipita sp. 399]